MGSPPMLQNMTPGAAYKELYDALGDAYWQASDITAKDTVHGLQESIGQILTAIDQQQLADNTAVFMAMGAQIQATNATLKKIQGSIDSITKNIGTASEVTGAIATVLSLFP